MVYTLHFKCTLCTMLPYLVQSPLKVLNHPFKNVAYYLCN